MNWILAFLDPDSGCFQQHQEWGFISCSRNRIGFEFCFYWRKHFCLFAWLVYTRTLTGVGLLESIWYRIRIGFGFTICKTGLEPDSKKSEPEHLYGAVHLSKSKATSTRTETTRWAKGQKLAWFWFSVWIQTAKAWPIPILLDLVVSSKRCRETYHRDNWLVAAKHS